jgi:hypothetical protein
MQVGAYENFEGCILDGCLVLVSTLMQFLNNEQIERGAVWKYFGIEKKWTIFYKRNFFLSIDMPKAL